MQISVHAKTFMVFLSLATVVPPASAGWLEPTAVVTRTNRHWMDGENPVTSVDVAESSPSSQVGVSDDIAARLGLGTRQEAFVQYGITNLEPGFQIMRLYVFDAWVNERYDFPDTWFLSISAGGGSDPLSVQNLGGPWDTPLGLQVPLGYHPGNPLVLDFDVTDAVSRYTQAGFGFLDLALSTASSHGVGGVQFVLAFEHQPHIAPEPSSFSLAAVAVVVTAFTAIWRKRNE